MSEGVQTQIICVASGKGGVAKTTTTFALGCAAAERGSVLVLDMDPSRSLSTQLKAPMDGPSIADVLEGKVGLEEAVVETVSGMLLIPGSKDIYLVEQSPETLQEALQTAMGLVDRILIDTQPFMAGLTDPMRFATKIVIPSLLDAVSMPVTAETIEAALGAGVGDRVAGILPVRVRRPLTRLARTLYKELLDNQVGLESVIWETTRWPVAVSSGTLAGQPELQAMALEVLDEVERKTCESMRLEKVAAIWRQWAKDRQQETLPQAAAPTGT